MTLENELIDIWTEFTERVSEFFINKYNNSANENFTADIPLSKAKRNLIYNEVFYVFYQIIDRELFRWIGPERRSEILIEIDKKAMLQHLEKTNQTENYEDFITKVYEKQEYWGQFKDLVNQEGNGGVFWDFAQNIAEIACNDRNSPSFLRIFQDTLFYHPQTVKHITDTLAYFQI